MKRFVWPREWLLLRARIPSWLAAIFAGIALLSVAVAVPAQAHEGRANKSAHDQPGNGWGSGGSGNGWGNGGSGNGWGNGGSGSNDGTQIANLKVIPAKESCPTLATTTEAGHQSTTSPPTSSATTLIVACSTAR